MKNKNMRPSADGMLLFVVAASVGLFAVPTIAEPLHDQDNGALTGMFQFPNSTEGATLVARGHHGISISVMTSSHSIDEVRGDETLILDGETTRLELSYLYGLGSRLEIGVRIPYLWHTSGKLDSLIKEWHRALGLPQGVRGDRANDLLHFEYRDGSGVLVDLRKTSDGLGDVRLVAGWQLSDRPTYRSALRLGVKLPTGDSAGLLGTGGTDFSVGVAGDASELFGNARWNGFYRAHATYIGEPELLADRYNEVVAQLSTGLGYWLSRKVELRAQVAARSETYDSRTEILGEPSVTLTVGGNIRLADDYQLSLAVSEDIKVRTAPDISFQVALRYRPAD